MSHKFNDHRDADLVKMRKAYDLLCKLDRMVLPGEMQADVERMRVKFGNEQPDAVPATRVSTLSEILTAIEVKLNEYSPASEEFSRYTTTKTMVLGSRGRKLTPRERVGCLDTALCHLPSMDLAIGDAIRQQRDYQLTKC